MVPVTDGIARGQKALLIYDYRCEQRNLRQ